MTLSDVNANYEDVFELDFTTIDAKDVIRKIEDNINWTQYNKSKPHIKREGLSVTSLDGGMTGDPDLHSLYEHYKETGNLYFETHFDQRTEVCNEVPEVNKVLDYFEGSVGRSHFIRLDSGGYFPPHRDNFSVVPNDTFRVVIPLVDFSPNSNFVWMLDGKPLHLFAGKTYYMNTFKTHSLFSMQKYCYILVYNIHDSAIPLLLQSSKAK